MQVDEVGGLDLGRVLEIVKDLGAASRAGPVALVEVLVLDFGDGLLPFRRRVGNGWRVRW